MGNNVNPARKILLIATGGTIACRETGHGLTPVLDGEGLLRELPGAFRGVQGRGTRSDAARLDRHHSGRPDADGAGGLGKTRSV